MNACKVFETQLSNDLSCVKNVSKANNCRSFTKGRWYTIKILGPELVAFIARLGELVCLIFIQPTKVISFTTKLVFIKQIKSLNALDEKIPGPAAVLLNSKKSLKLFLGLFSTLFIGSLISTKANISIHTCLNLIEKESQPPKRANTQSMINSIEEKTNPFSHEPAPLNQEEEKAEQGDSFGHLYDASNQKSLNHSAGILNSNSSSDTCENPVEKGGYDLERESSSEPPITANTPRSVPENAGKSPSSPVLGSSSSSETTNPTPTRGSSFCADHSPPPPANQTPSIPHFQSPTAAPTSPPPTSPPPTSSSQDRFSSSLVDSPDARKGGAALATYLSPEGSNSGAKKSGNCPLPRELKLLLEKKKDPKASPPEQGSLSKSCSTYVLPEGQ